MNEKEFIVKLYEVVNKLSIIAKTQIPRFKREWEKNFSYLHEIPSLDFHQYLVDKNKFINDKKYRIEILETIKRSFDDTITMIKLLLDVLYNYYFKDLQYFKKEYNERDQIVLTYIVAKEILGNLIQYICIEHNKIPLKYYIFVRNYLLIKLKGLSALEILENMKKINIELKLDDLKKIMNKIVKDGFLKKVKHEKDFYYEVHLELILSDEATFKYRQTIQPIVKWPVLFWDDYFNIRELNVRLDDNEFLNNILKRSATQGYTSAWFVFNGLIEYFKGNIKFK